METVGDNIITCIEGNLNNKVGCQITKIGDGRIRGYARHKYSIKNSTKSIIDIARESINGKWGNGQDRKNHLAKVGYNYNEVQKKVNELLK